VGTRDENRPAHDGAIAHGQSPPPLAGEGWVGAGPHIHILPDGRRLAYELQGPPDGTHVVALHGLPGSRLQRHPDTGIAWRANAQLLTVDRPGFGRSDWRDYRRLADFADDLASLADTLCIERFILAGISGGGPYACAIAAALPERIRALGLVSSVGPPGSMSAGAVGLAFGLARGSPGLLRLLLGPLCWLPRHAPRAYLRLLAHVMNAHDARILHRPEVRAMFAADLRAGLAQGARAFARDLALMAAPWQVDFASIAAPVRIWHGADDRMVPPAASRALARVIPDARLELYRGEGHFMVLERWESMLGGLIAAAR
jgi:pimeloyl-ACP methyl ester carboxylesterase